MYRPLVHSRHLSYATVTWAALFTHLWISQSLLISLASSFCWKGSSHSLFPYCQIPRLEFFQMLPLNHHYFYYVTHICDCFPKCFILTYKCKIGNVCMYGQNFRVREKKSVCIPLLELENCHWEGHLYYMCSVEVYGMDE